MIYSLIYVIFLHRVACDFSQQDKIDILRVHNNLRAQIALGKFSAKNQMMPPAADMTKMSWSTTLEQSAQDYANKCVFEHSKIKSIGENLYMSWSSGVDTIEGKGNLSATAWANEFQTYGWPSLKFSIDIAESGIGHATQGQFHKHEYVHSWYHMLKVLKKDVVRKINCAVQVSMHDINNRWTRIDSQPPQSRNAGSDNEYRMPHLKGSFRPRTYLAWSN